MFNLFGKKTKMIKPTTKVYQKQILKGVSIPAIIRNGSYFFVDIHVYENGRVYCWDFEDLEHFKKQVSKNWVVLEIPDGEQISIHGLGNWTITNSDWLFDKSSFIDYVLQLIKDMNPEMENLYKYIPKEVAGIRIGEHGEGTVYKEHSRYSNDSFPDRIDGDYVNLFYKKDDGYYLIELNVFADGVIQIGRLENPIEMNMIEFEELVSKEIVVSEVSQNSQVYIYGLGKFIAQYSQYVVDIQDKVLEIKDIQRRLKGEPSTVEICRNDYQEYLKNPTATNKEKLKISYESIPKHQRAYVGDMDVKDTEVRMILYGKQEIEKWSHYQLAKQLGEQLPSI